MERCRAAGVSDSDSDELDFVREPHDITQLAGKWTNPVQVSSTVDTSADKSSIDQNKQCFSKQTYQQQSHASATDGQRCVPIGRGYWLGINKEFTCATNKPGYGSEPTSFMSSRSQLQSAGVSSMEATSEDRQSCSNSGWNEMGGHSSPSINSISQVSNSQAAFSESQCSDFNVNTTKRDFYNIEEKKGSEGNVASSSLSNTTAEHSREQSAMRSDSVGYNNTEMPEELSSQCAPVPQQSLEEMRAILMNLEAMWHREVDKNKVRLVEALPNIFSKSINPFALVAYLIEHANGATCAKTTNLSFLLLKELDKWSSRNRYLDRSSLLNRDLKMNVFDVCTRHHLTMFDLANKCFQLRFQGNHIFLPRIREFLADKKFKQVAVCAGKLRLQEHFEMREVVVPLLLQDRVNLVEVFVQGCEVQQRALVQYLDHLSDHTTDLQQERSFIDEVPQVRGDKFKKKQLGKLAARLMKMYRIPQELCPNIMNARGVGAIRYLLHKNFIEKAMGSGSWEEMIENAVGNNQYLKGQLVEQLMCFNATEEAAKWALRYQLPEETLSTSVQKAVKLKLKETRQKKAESTSSSHTGSSSQTAGSTAGATEENWEDELFTDEEIRAAYYQLKLPTDEILLVDTAEKFGECIHYVTQPGQIVGIDSEWKPVFCGQNERVALIQLATHKRAFLIDIPALDKIFSAADWERFAEDFFCSNQVLKLGYGIESDLKMLIRTFPGMKEPLIELKRVVNLDKIAAKVFKSEVVMFDEDEDNDRLIKQGENSKPAPMQTGFSPTEERGLSELVRRCFGKPLCKSEQMSDWERRPLRREQVTYAALDAYVLLELYDHLTRLVHQQNLHVNMEPVISMKWMKPSKREKKRERFRGRGSPRPPPKQMAPVPRLTGPPIKPSDLRVVVDTMLQGLGKQLRSCGIDVYIPDSTATHGDAVEICRQQQRIILTSGNPFSMIQARVGPGQCYCVVSKTARDQVVEVLDHFNVQVCQSDIFSRCQVCNGDRYVTIPPDLFNQLWTRKHVEMIQSGSRQQASSQPARTHNVAGSDTMSPGAATVALATLGIDLDLVCMADTGVPLQVTQVPHAMLAKVLMFYCCVTCGKVFWEGSHFERVQEQFSHVLLPPTDGIRKETVYQSFTK